MILSGIYSTGRLCHALSVAVPKLWSGLGNFSRGKKTPINCGIDAEYIFPSGRQPCRGLTGFLQGSLALKSFAVLLPCELGSHEKENDWP